MDPKKLSELSQPGDNCGTCLKQWTHQKMEPKKLQEVIGADGKPLVTPNGVPILACPFCDGELIFVLSKDVIDDEAESDTEVEPEND